MGKAYELAAAHSTARKAIEIDWSVIGESVWLEALPPGLELERVL